MTISPKPRMTAVAILLVNEKLNRGKVFKDNQATDVNVYVSIPNSEEFDHEMMADYIKKRMALMGWSQSLPISIDTTENGSMIRVVLKNPDCSPVASFRDLADIELTINNTLSRLKASAGGMFVDLSEHVHEVDPRLERYLQRLYSMFGWGKVHLDSHNDLVMLFVR